MLCRRSGVAGLSTNLLFPDLYTIQSPTERRQPTSLDNHYQATMSFFYSLLHDKFYPLANPKSSFSGKTVLITGANCGLGFEAALKFTSLGASTVILACRSSSKGEAAAGQIEQRTGLTGIVRVWELDMNRYDSLRALATRVKDELPRLDIALLNAGVVQPHCRKSPEGWEETLQVNVLSTVLLGILLLPILEESAATGFKEDQEARQASHLCFVSSGNYEFADIPPSVRNDPSVLRYYSHPDNFAGVEPQYNLSKLFLMYAVNELAARSDARKKDGSGSVIINSVNPGATATSLTRNIDSLALRLLAFVYLRLLARTAEQGSRSLVSACTIGKEGHGRLWAHDTFQV